MSDTSSTFIKVLAALVSPKAALQYICSALCLAFFWGYLNEALVAYGAPTEHLSLIALLLSAGVGSLVGGGIYFCGSCLASAIQKLASQRAAAEIQKAEAAKSLALQEAKDKKLLDTFTIALPHMYMYKKMELYHLLRGESCLDTGYEHIHELIVSNYILKLASPSEGRAVCIINPVIESHVRRYWDDKTARDTKEFLNSLDENRRTAIEIMTYKDEVFGGPVSRTFIESLISLQPVFSVEGRDADGFTLCLYEPYNSALSSHYNKDFWDEIYISHSWID
ncbi:hypothetical protein D3C78_440290 [compost metagenome]